MITERCHRVAGSRDRRRVARGFLIGGAVWLAAWVVGCSQTTDEPVALSVAQGPPDRTIAVAPALNFSGGREFDPVQVADLLASELSQVPHLGVVGVSRVLAVLVEQGHERIQSPAHAVEVAERLGVDAIVVFAVTEYDPYTPIVGLAAQLYERRAGAASLDLVATSRMARPFPVAGGARRHGPSAQTQRTFNAAHEDVECDVRHYAKMRSAGNSPYGWRRYLVSQEWFLRFCCHAVVRDLMAQWRGEAYVVAGTVGADRSE